MKEAKTREKRFRKALEKLLKEHGAELDVTDDGKEYGLHSGVARITMYAIWENNECKKEFCEFNL